MRRIRFWFLLLLVFIRRFSGLLLSGFIIGIFLFLILPRLPTVSERFAKTERIGLVGRFSQEQLPLFIQQQISLGLTKLDEKGVPKSGLALSWEERDDAKVWIFKLDPNMTWQDEKPITSENINYKFEDVTIKRPDSLTLEFHLKDSYSPFPAIVAKPTFRRGLLGAGEYKASRIVSTGQYVKELLLVRQKPESGRILYRFYPTESSAITAIKLGEVDKLLNIFDASEIAKWQNFSVQKVVQSDKYVVIFLNTQDPLLADKSFRQALAYSIDKEKLAKERAISPIIPSSWAYNPLIKPYEYSKERAQDLLSELTEEQQDMLEIKLVTIPSLLKVAEVIESFWEEIGVKTQVQVSNTPPQEFQALLATQAVPADPDQYSLWHSTQTATNITSYKDPRIDKLLEDGRKTLSLEERKKIYFDFQRFLVEDSPAIFLYFAETYTISRR